VNNKHVTEN